MAGYDFPTLVSRVIQQESGGNPTAVSPVGAMGLMQVMPDTARSPGFGIQPLQNPFDPAENRRFGEQYLQAMLDRYNGDQERALVAYNWGPGNADRWDGSRSSLPGETQGYLRNILGGADSGAAVAADTRAALGLGGQPPQVSTRGTQPMATPTMPPREEPQGLLQMLGIQKMGEGPEGDKRFYQRDRFADAMGVVATAANTLRARPDPNINAAMQMGRQRRDANRTAEWLGQQEGGAEFAQMIASGANPAEALMAYRQSRQPAQTFRQVRGSDLGMTGESAGALFNVSPDGKITAIGGAGPNININTADPMSRYLYGSDAGLPAGWRIDRQTGEASRIPGGPAAAEAETAQTADQVAADKASASIEQIDAILNDPALPSITGMVQGRIAPLSQEGTDLNVRLTQLKGQAFLQAFESLKGGGQITEKEGNAATDAMARLDRTQSEDAMMQALTELRYIMDRAKQRATGQDVGEYDFSGFWSQQSAPSDTSQMSDDELLQLYGGGN